MWVGSAPVDDGSVACRASDLTGRMRSLRQASVDGNTTVRWQERFIIAANIELLEERLGGGKMDERQAVTVQALLIEYRQRWSHLEQLYALGHP